MKHTSILVTILAIAACGGKPPEPEKPKAPDPDETATPPPSEPAKAEPAAPAEPTEAPVPPPPKAVHAQAELTPNKGIKMKAATITFAQEEGQPTQVASTGWFDGIKAGKYHLVVHEGAECGGKAGKPMTGADIAFAVTKGSTSLEVQPSASIQLEGDTAVIGHALVLHDDKKGKAGKPLACGTIGAND